MAGPLAAVTALALCASGTAVAAAAEEDQLPEIIVTAQFIKENVQTTPLAITAVNAEMLEARSQVSVQEVAAQAPNVTLKAAGTSMGPSLIGFIRGIGQTDFNPALEPGVGLYVDDVYYSTLTGSVLDLLDLDRVEVLRGPQGTLAGKNSIGGSIKLYSKKPKGDGSGFAEVGYGQYNSVSVRAAADFALVPDTLMIRIAGVSRTRDGYVTRLDYGCTHPGSGVPVYAARGGTCELGKEGGIQYTAGRLSVRWVASDSVEVNLAADVVRDRSQPPANVLTAVGPTLLPVGIDTDNNPSTGQMGFWFVAAPGPHPTGYDLIWNGANLAPSASCLFIAYGSSSCDPNRPNNRYVNYATYTDPRAPFSDGITGSPYTPVALDPVQLLNSKGVSANIDWQITSTLQLQSITAWRRYDSTWSDDADGTPITVQLLTQSLYHQQKSQELRLNGKAGSILDWTLGGFWFDQDTNEDARVDIPYAALDFIHGPDLVPARTWAVFGHGIFHLGEKANVAVGVRRTDEKKDYTYRRHNPDGTLPCTAPYFVNCALSGLNGQGGHFADQRMDYRAALNYTWTDDLMTYLQFSTGYKGGGINPRPFYPQQVLPFGPEKLTAYEVGLKSQFFDRKLRLNLALFFNKYKDIQLGLSDCTRFAGEGWGVPCILPANVGSADVKGGELEFTWYPVAGMELDGSVSKLDFKYTELDPLAGIPDGGISPYTPELKWSVGAQYEFKLPSGGSITPRVDASYQGETWANATNSPNAHMDSYALINGRITWRSEDELWQIALEGQNLANKYYFNTKFDLTTTLGGFAGGQPGIPRNWMLTLKRSFH